MPRSQTPTCAPTSPTRRRTCSVWVRRGTPLRMDARLLSLQLTLCHPLVVNPDNSFEVLVDQTVVNSGNLLKDMTPPVNPPAEIEDPEDQKPEDWDERPKIQDPDAAKPEDW